MCTHNLCIEQKIRKMSIFFIRKFWIFTTENRILHKIGIPFFYPKFSILVYKKGFSWVYISRICLRDEMRITTSVDVQSSHLYKCPVKI